jgi:DNA-binding GntR family transcriptional regulator
VPEPVKRRTTQEKTAPAGARAVPLASPVKPQQFSRPVWLADIVRERIVNGVYRPGSRIREADLQEEFAFSNGPIREALQMIVAEGLAERFPWQGVRVVSLDDRQVAELFQVRFALLEYAAELAVRNASAAALSAVPMLKKRMDKRYAEAKSGGQHPSCHGDLSQWLLSTAGNGKLRKLWDSTMLQTLIYVNVSMRRAVAEKSRILVHQLIDAIVARNIPMARDAARKLTQQTLQDLGIDSTI